MAEYIWFSSWNGASSVPTLFKLCIDAILRYRKSHGQLPAGAERLPAPHKRILFDLLLRRGLVEDCEVSALASNEITEIDLSDCSNISDTALLGIAAAKPTSLRCLKLHVPGRHTRPEISDKGLCNLLAECGTHLVEINLKNCTSIGDQTLEAISNYCPKVAVLNLCNCAGITDKGVASLRSLEHLTALSLSSTAVSDVGVEALCGEDSRLCNTLREMELSRTKISDRSVLLLVDRCPNLTQLAISGCRRLTPASRQALDRLPLQQLVWSIA